MSVRVNLLPQATKDRERVVRQRGVALTALLGLVALLGMAYWFQVSRVNEREAVLAAELETVTGLQGEVEELNEFEQLQTRRDRADGIVSAAMGDEVSFAAALQDMAAVTPSSTWLESLGISLQEEPTVPLGADRTIIGRVTAAGLESQSHAPGLERLLLELDKVVSFDNIFFTDSTIVGDEREFVGGDGDESTFSLEMDLGLEARTGRYVEGVPEVLR
jgi:Tfp pilus assembly protein PilN